MTARPIPTESTEPRNGRAVSCCAAAAGATRSANTRSAPVIWLVAATASPSRSRKPSESARTGTPAARATSPSTDAKRSGRPATARTSSAPGGDADERVRLPVGDAEEGAEEQRVETVQQAVVETDEQEAEPERERLHGARRRRLAAVAARAVGGDAGERERSRDAGAEVARGERQSREARAGGAGEGDHRERVPGERLPAQHHEPADRSRHHRDRGARLERVDHEVVGDELRARRRRGSRTAPGRRPPQCSWRWPCTNGASGWPTTTRRPSLARSTSTGAA